MPTLSAHLAEWRDAQGDVHRQVWTNTMCRSPVVPRSFAARSADGDYEVVLRCRDCEGCRAYEALILRRRLAAWLNQQREAIWVYRFRGRERFNGSTNGRSRIAIRQPRGSLGWVRCGPTGYVSIVAEKGGRCRAGATSSPLQPHRRKLVRPVLQRSLRSLTAGMLVSRSVYGPNRNRYYFRRMPPLARAMLELELRGGIRKRHPDARAGVVVWRRGLALYPSARALVQRLIPNVVLGVGTRLAIPTPRSRALARLDLVRCGVSRFPSIGRRPDPQRDLSLDGGDASSLNSTPHWAAAWAQRMALLSAQRHTHGP